MGKLLLAFLLLGGFARGQELSFKIKHQEEAHGLGYKKSTKVKGIKQVDFWRELPHAPMPNRVDLRAVGHGLSQIENQGQAGTCWAHSLTASLRDTWLLNGTDPGRISMQYLVDAAAPLGEGCDGGDFDAAKYFFWPKGAPTWASYPYSDKKCDGKLKKSLPKAGIANLVMIAPSHYNMMYVLHVLKRPLSVVVAAGTGLWESYDGGVYNACRVGGIDHMINMVGLDMEGASFDSNGNLPHGKGIGILRNSWGPEWGEAGWMNTKLTDSKGRACNGIAVEAGYFEMGKTPKPQ